MYDEIHKKETVIELPTYIPFHVSNLINRTKTIDNLTLPDFIETIVEHDTFIPIIDNHTSINILDFILRKNMKYYNKKELNPNQEIKLMFAFIGKMNNDEEEDELFLYEIGMQLVT